MQTEIKYENNEFRALGRNGSKSETYIEFNAGGMLTRQLTDSQINQLWEERAARGIKEIVSTGGLRFPKLAAPKIQTIEEHLAEVFGN